MFRFLLPVICILVLASCNNNGDTSDNLLQKPPYNKLTDSIKLAPNRAELYYHRGSQLYYNNQFAHAEQDLRTAWQLDPKEEYALSLTTVLKEKNTDSAIAFLQTAINKLPNSIALKIGLARGYQQKGTPDKSLQICDNIIQQYPNQIDALLFKAEILKNQNQTTDALAIMEKAYDYAPGDKEIAYDLAYDYAEAKDAKALKLADSLSKHDSSETNVRATYIIATYYKNIGNNNEALKNYDAAIVKDFNFMDAYLDKGQLLYNMKRYADAQKVFETAQRVSPSTADFFFWIGKTQEAQGHKEDAKLNYQRAYTLDKTMTEAKQAADRL